MKRLLDIMAALTGLMLLAPLLILIAILIWAEDRRSPLYLARRVARGGGDFRMVKLRTMVPDAWRSGVNSTAAGDPRITRVGWWLRKGKLDELPQLWNVLVGDMSLVGPRPQVRADVELYTREESRMLSARPGITDLASIVFADEGDILEGSADPDLLYNQIVRPWKSRLILLYLETPTVSCDLQILWLTALSLFSRERALAGLARLLSDLGAGEQLKAVASRRYPLQAWPPPGADAVVARYRLSPVSREEVPAHT